MEISKEVIESILVDFLMFEKQSVMTYTELDAKQYLKTYMNVVKKLNIPPVSKSLGYDPDKVCIVNGVTCSDKDYQGWKMSSFETIEGYLHAIGK